MADSGFSSGFSSGRSQAASSALVQKARSPQRTKITGVSKRSGRGGKRY